MPVDKVGVRLSTDPFMRGACKHSPQWTHCTHTCCHRYIWLSPACCHGDAAVL